MAHSDEMMKTEQHANTDMLSRSPDPDETMAEEPNTYTESCVDDIPVSANNIATETRKYTIIAQVCEYVMG